MTSFSELRSSRCQSKLRRGPELIAAARSGERRRCKRLLKAGAPAGFRDVDDRTPFMWACEEGRIEVMKLLAKTGADVNQTARDGSNRPCPGIPLGSFRVVRLLLERGANVRAREGLLGATALIFACLAGHLEIARDLLHHGAEINARTNDGRTALLEASFAGHRKIVQMLLDRGAHVNVRNAHWTTPLIAASITGEPEIVEILLENGAKVTDRNKYGKTPLMEASLAGCRKTVELLLAHGANIEATDNECQTALMLAARSGHTDVVQVLVKHGADKTHQDGKGNTALSTALNFGCQEVVQLLRAAAGSHASTHCTAV